MQLATIDYAIIIGFFILSLVIGILVAKQSGITIDDEKIAMGVDAILGSNEALIMGCIEGRYPNKEDAINLASNIIINQITSTIELEKKA